MEIAHSCFRKPKRKSPLWSYETAECPCFIKTVQMFLEMFVFDPQTLYQEEVDQSKSSRRISEQPLFGTNDVAEAPPVSEDISSFSDLCRYNPDVQEQRC